MFLVMLIPIINLGVLFYRGFIGNTNTNLRNFSRALLIASAVGILITATLELF